MGQLAWAQDNSLQKAIELQFNYPNSAISIAQELIESDDRKLSSNAYEVVGIASWILEDYASAIEAHSSSLTIRKELGYQSGVGHS